MFDNIGGKLKGVATIFCWLGIIGSILIGLITFLQGGILIMIVGSLSSWLGSLALYGFGQLIENSDKLVAELVPEKPAYVPPVMQQPQQTAQNWACPVCGQWQPAGTYFCSTCGATPQGGQYNRQATWYCYSCGTANEGSNQYCRQCNVSKGWSEKKRMGL